MQESKWVPIAEFLVGLKARFAELQTIEIPSTANAAPKVRTELAELEGELGGSGTDGCRPLWKVRS